MKNDADNPGFLARCRRRLHGEPLPRATAAALLKAQSEALSRQIPLLYAILSINVATAAWSHIGHAPWPLSVLIPAILVTACTLRSYSWFTRERQETTAEVVSHQLRRTTFIAGGFCVAFLSWLYGLYQYGDTATRGQLAGTFGTTIVCGIACLLHVRQISLLIACLTIPAIASFLILSGQRHEVAFGVNLLLVGGVMAYMALRMSRDFSRLVVAQAAAKDLSDINHRLASIDNLTGLPNRRQFFERLSALFARHAQSGRFYVGLLDLDGFKAVNDVYGHAAGDRVLTDSSARLREVADGRVFIARLGGDEFGLLIDGIESDQEVIAIAARMAASLRTPFAVEEHLATLSVSIGLADFPDAASTPQQLYERADYALYYAKQNRRGAPVLFDVAHEARMRAELRIDQRLRHPALEQELSLAFLPIHDLAVGGLVAVEALARWHSPELGEVPPAQFIPIAERSEAIHEISCILLRKALAAAAHWPDGVRLSFNLSARDLISPVATARIMSIVEQSGVPPTRLDFEVTETALMTDFDSAARSIEALKAMGARISLDDFGTGYSSLSYVHRLPLDCIKIDRSFVREIAGNELAQGIVSAIVTMCGKLKLPCVAEGIETEAELQHVRGYGCNWAQGYYFGLPVPLGEVQRLFGRSGHDGAAPALQLATSDAASPPLAAGFGAP